ncbi:MAG: VCBS repeat-containing protein, partial [Bacteroidetes bacterium]|nr:VCBS repeat-containing protein [Bacteroidota bacterium]
GDEDIVVTNVGSDNVSILLNDGDGSYSNVQAYSVGSSPREVQVGDLNGDGLDDVVVANLGGDISVLINQQAGSFAPAITYSAGSMSYSVAMSDVDNDGDLDIITNNVDDKAFLFKNNLNETVTTNYLAIKIVGEEGNNHGVGAKIYLNSSLGTQFCEISLNRGYQSSQILPIHFGLGSSKKVDELRVEWPDGRVSLLKDLDANQLLTLDQRDAVEVEQISVTPTEKLFSDITAGSGVNFKHQENVFDDFKKETLLPHKQSQHGAKLAVGDVNGDGLDDFYIGGAAGQTGALYLQQEGKRFKRSSGQPWSKDAASEDIDALFVDTDGDDDLDLYIVSGGNEFESGSPLLNDRLYENDGHGNFTKTTGKLPQVNSSGGCVAAGDFDNDGDADLFVGGRIVPGRYPFPARSYLLQNEGGVFKDVTATKARDLLTPGLVTSAIWSDYNDDGKQDLLVVGEWMPISIFENKGGRLVSVTEEIGFQDQTGWWASIAAADFDGDGDMDYVVGNLGLNSKYKATKEEPLHVYCHDFDDNGTLDIVLGYYNGGDCYPVRGRQCSSEQMPFIKKKFPNYQAFGMATLQDIYGESLENALQHQMARTFASCYIENKGDQGFIITKLPVEAQFSMVQGIIPYDFDEDGKLDLLIAGNLFPAEVETGKHDASIGLFLKGDGKGNFESVRSMNSGFYTPGDVRDLSLLGTGSTPLVVISNNNGNVQIIRINGNMKKQTLAVN